MAAYKKSGSMKKVQPRTGARKRTGAMNRAGAVKKGTTARGRSADSARKKAEAMSAMTGMRVTGKGGSGKYYRGR